MHSKIFDLRIIPLRDKLFRYACFLVNNRTEAEDIVQETLLKIWLKRNELDKVSNMEAWGITIVKNLSIDHLRRIKRHNAAEFKNESLDMDLESPDKSLMREEIINNVRRLIQELPERQQQLVFLRDIEGHTYSEISRIMGLSENLVKVSLFRARENLRRKILKIENYGI